MDQCLAVVVDSNQERKIHLSMVLSSLGQKYLSLTNLEDLAGVIRGGDESRIFFIGADKNFSNLSSVVRALKNFDQQVALILVGAASRDVPESLKQFVTLVIEGSSCTQELKSAIELVESEMEEEKKITTTQSASYKWHLIGSSGQMLIVKELINKVAATDVSVLIGGESGSGKELAAHAIHELSSRSKHAFVPVNCGAIPSELIESELFGHEKGAFTGAVASRVGRFEQAHGGTIFLDEIGDMPMDMQVKLLRILQERRFERVGGSKSIEVDVRVIAATHQNLEALIEAGKFREDLYYRINVFPIDMPALRERQVDFLNIIQALIDEVAANRGSGFRLSQGAAESLAAYSWPGNVRELRNLVERLSVLFPNQLVDLSDLPNRYQVEKAIIDSPILGSADAREEIASVMDSPELFNSPIDLKAHIQNLEKNYLQAALNQSDGVVARAAKLLGMQRTTLVEKMRKFDIERSK